MQCKDSNYEWRKNRTDGRKDRMREEGWKKGGERNGVKGKDGQKGEKERGKKTRLKA
jgi:hypothetical protein